MARFAWGRSGLVLVAMGIGCGESRLADPVTGLDPAEGASPSRVVGNLEWSDVTSLGGGTPVRERTRPVGFLGLPARGAWCSAVLIAPSAVLTASDCVEEEGDLDGAYLALRRETGVPPAEWRRYACERLLTRAPDLEFAVLECADQPGDTFGVAEIAWGRHLAVETEVYLIQQACNHFAAEGCEPTKRLADGAVTRSAGSGFEHDADALEGALGGPILDREDHAVVGLHLGGVSDRRVNRAVLATEVRARIAERLPDLELGGRSSVFGAPPLPPDPHEPNEDTESATVVPVGYESSGTSVGEGDVDVFRLDLVAGADLQVQLDFEHGQGDLDLAIHAVELDGPKIGSGVSATDGESVRLRASRDGPYFLKVYGYQGATNAYTLRIRDR